MPTATEVNVPDLGDFTDVPVIEIHVATGDVVSEEDPLITLESDKATMDIPRPRPAQSASSGSRSATGSKRVRSSSFSTLTAHSPSRRR